MKKISLEMLRLSSDEVLERSQMKKITGGYGGRWLTCSNWTRAIEVPYCGAGIVSFYCSEGGTCN